MSSKLIETQWGVFSKNFVKFHRLPFGSELRLFDETTERKKRSDFLVKRKRVSSKTMIRADDNDNVKSLLEYALKAISTDIKARGLKLELFGPNGELVNGNKKIRTMRQMEPKPTADDIEQMEADEQLITEVQSNAHAAIIESEYLIDDPSSTVCSGYVRALVDRYGRVAVLSALGQ